MDANIGAEAQAPSPARLDAGAPKAGAVWLLVRLGVPLLAIALMTVYATFNHAVEMVRAGNVLVLVHYVLQTTAIVVAVSYGVMSARRWAFVAAAFLAQTVIDSLLLHHFATGTFIFAAGASVLGLYRLLKQRKAAV